MHSLAARLVVLAVAVSSACSPAKDAFEVQAGTEVTLEKKDGVKVSGRLVEVKPEQIVLETRDGVKTVVPRADVAALRALTSTPAAAPPLSAPAPASGGDPGPRPAPVGAMGAADPAPRAGTSAPAPAFREVTIPSGTVLAVELQNAVSSDGSKVEDRVRASLRRAVTVEGKEALPAGTAVTGHVTGAERAARVKGRAFVSFRFTSIDPPGDAAQLAIRSEVITRLAPATKKQDAAKIGGGAVGGAIIGGILGGGDGAAKGAAIGGAAGTGVVLSTRGKEVRLGPGADLTVRLTAPVILRIREG